MFKRGILYNDHIWYGISNIQKRGISWKFTQWISLTIEIEKEKRGYCNMTERVTKRGIREFILICILVDVGRNLCSSKGVSSHNLFKNYEFLTL